MKFKKEEIKMPVAKVYNKILYQSEIDAVLVSNLAKQDSVLFVENYINSWAKQQLLLHQAELNLKDETISFEKLVSDYRATLFINAYKEALVSNKLDTLVTDYQIEKYYVANHDNFKLNEELVQLKYLHTNKNRADKRGLIKLFKSNKATDKDSLQLRTLEFKSFNFNDSIWIKYNDLLNEIDYLKSENKKNILKKSNFLQKEDSLGLYLITIKDVLKRNEIAPINYVSPTIKQIILHKRKLELLRKIEVDLLNDAIKNQKFETY
ncbi:MAG: peptidylprolyl isomerase [Lutibacter sp.]|nr:MAG: peptidylprolyl isomerase [Lutibacter sp.]